MQSAEFHGPQLGRRYRRRSDPHPPCRNSGRTPGRAPRWRSPRPGESPDRDHARGTSRPCQAPLANELMRRQILTRPECLENAQVGPSLFRFLEVHAFNVTVCDGIPVPPGRYCPLPPARLLADIESWVSSFDRTRESSKSGLPVRRKVWCMSGRNCKFVTDPSPCQPSIATCAGREVGLIRLIFCPDCRCLTRRIELGAERESFLQVFDEDAYFGGQPAASRSNRKDRHDSFVRSQKTDDSTFSEFCREEPCGRLSNPQMFENTHPHLFNIAGTKDSCGGNTLRRLAQSQRSTAVQSPARQKQQTENV